MWPKPSQQSRWLRLMAQASVVVECRAGESLQGIGIKSEWPRPKRQNFISHQIDGPTLLLAMKHSIAEAELAAVGSRLDANRYSAVLRLDAELQLQNPGLWLWNNYKVMVHGLDEYNPFGWGSQRKRYLHGPNNAVQISE